MLKSETLEGVILAPPSLFGSKYFFSQANTPVSPRWNGEGEKIRDYRTGNNNNNNTPLTVAQKRLEKKELSPL